MGVIGYGYWGPNLVRNFAELVEARVVGISDQSGERLRQAAVRDPHIVLTTEADDLLRHPEIEAVAIATPVSTHYELAMRALEAGKHVLVTKPLAASSLEGMRLAEEAERRGLTLMVDHTFVYTGAVRKIRELVAEGELGKLYYYDSVRVNLGLFQHDVDVLWDLAIHDLAILHHVTGQLPTSVAATGVAHVPGRPVNIAYLTLFFEDNLIAHLHVNWLAPVKLRRTLLGGDQKMIVYDDLEPSEKVKIYDRGIVLDDGGGEGLCRLLVGYRSGDVWVPQLSIAEALRVEGQHFVECVRSGLRPQTDAYEGVQLLQILEAASLSLQRRGDPVELRWEETTGISA